MEEIFSKEIEQFRKELRLTRIFCGVTSLLVIALLVGGGFLFGWVKEYVEGVGPVLENLAEVDFNRINDTLYALGDTLESVNWEGMSTQLAALDVEAVNEAVRALDVEAINGAIAGLDTEELSKALENLNGAVETMQRLVESLKTFIGKFGL